MFAAHRPRLIVIIICFVVAAGRTAAGQETGPQNVESPILRVATWNLLNLFDGHDDPYHSDEGTLPKSYVDLVRLAKAIDEIDADVLAVEEVENRGILQEVNRHLARPFAWVELIEGNDGRGIDVGILSRIPIETATSHRHLDIGRGKRFARDFPVFRLRPMAGRWIDIGVVHLKSRRGRHSSRGWRGAEAAAVSRIVKDRRHRRPDVPILVMGDFNDSREAATLSPLFETMRDCTLDVPDDKRYTFVYGRKKEQIDYILAAGGIEPSTARIIHRKDRVSDHRAVVCTFDLGAPVQRKRLPPGKPWRAPKRPRLRAEDLQALGRHILQEVEIEGEVVKVHHTRSGNWVALNFAKDYKRAVAVRIYKESFARFPNLDSLVGKHVIARGPICRDRGAYRMTISDRSQLDVEPLRR